MTRLLIMAILILAAFPLYAEPVAYKVEQIVRLRPTSYIEGTGDLSGPLAQIEIGTAENTPERRPLPPREEFNKTILIGSQGVTDRTYFQGYEKRCEFLCGDELQECHYTAKLGWEDQSIGTPLLALTGVSGKPDAFTAFDDTGAGESVPAIELPAQALAWPDNHHLALVMGDDRAVFDVSVESGDPYQFDFEAPDCKWFSYPGTELHRLSCNSAEALFHQRRPLLYSMADYNISSVRLLSRFTVDGQHYYTVMIALKAYTAYGVLTQKAGKWVFIVNPANWALIC